MDEGALFAGYEASGHRACHAHQLAHEGLQAEQPCTALSDIMLIPPATPKAAFPDTHQCQLVYPCSDTFW